MNTRFFLPALALLSIIYTSCSQETCTVRPEYFNEGTNVKISYDPSKSYLKGDIDGVYYLWKDYKWEAFDMDLKKRPGGRLSTSFTVPEGTALTVWKFYDKDTVDIGGPSFLYAKYVLTPENRNMPSANIGWGLLRGKNTQSMAGIPSLENAGFEAKDDEVVRMWINNELRDNPDQLKNVFWYATNLLARDTTASKDNMLQLIRGLIDTDKAAPDSLRLSEEQLMKAHKLVSSTLPDPELKSEIETILLQRYPNGQFFREKTVREIMMSDKKDNMDPVFKEFIKNFPPEKFENAFVEDELFWHYYSNMLRIYVYTPIVKNNDKSRIAECLSMSPRSNLAMYFWHMVQIPLSRGDASAEELYPLAELIYTEMITRPRNDSEKVWSPKEWRAKFYSDNKNICLDYAKILDGVGEGAHALELIDTLQPIFKARNTSFNDFYVKLLEDAGNGEKSLEVIKAAIEENQASPQMLEILKEDYIRKGNEASGFDAYVNSLKSASVSQSQREHLLSSMIDTPTKLFELESLDGEKVDMARLKGHILVLDFWATWCGPCKAAMPGMKMALDKYKDDPNVDFFFISTMETRPDFKEKIKEFMDEKGYDFQVLLDNPDDKDRRQAVYSYYAGQFGFSGIPQKMIIDGNGNVRWIAVGYNGSPTALADEISIIIEEIRK